MQRPDLVGGRAPDRRRGRGHRAEPGAALPARDHRRLGRPGLLRVDSVSTSGTLWTIGPVQVSLPIFDGGTRVANVVAARARYDEAVSAYRGLIRGAVREVESALITLDSSARRVQDTRIAVEGFEASLKAADARFRGGLGSLFDLEDARRSALRRQQHADRAAARAGGRLDQPVPRARRRLEPRARRHHRGRRAPMNPDEDHDPAKARPCGWRWPPPRCWALPRWRCAPPTTRRPRRPRPRARR